jgi:acylpyruvate hydrolase
VIAPPTNLLVRFAEPGSEVLRPGLLVGDRVVDISVQYATIASFLADYPEGWPAHRPVPLGATIYDRAGLRLGPPVDEGNIVYAVGANYRAHAVEAGLDVPDQPVVFLKPYTALVGPDEAIRIPPVSTKLDYEGEMAVVIGRRASRLTRATAPSYVAGVTILNDTTARDLQWAMLGPNRIVDWFASKALDASSPLGPGVASITGFADIHTLRLRTTLNGRVMQDADTSLMVFDTWQLLEFITAHVTLRPGDVVATGTPFGVGGFRNIFLNPDDVVRVELDGVGVLENVVRRAPEPVR